MDPLSRSYWDICLAMDRTLCHERLCRSFTDLGAYYFQNGGQNHCDLRGLGAKRGETDSAVPGRLWFFELGTGNQNPGTGSEAEPC